AEQMDYLVSVGFRTVTPKDWLAAVLNRQPLPGRAVMLTFDDGFADFASHAWPILRQRGFSAINFLVGDLLGQGARWNGGFGETAPLMSAEDVAALCAQGAAFG